MSIYSQLQALDVFHGRLIGKSTHVIDRISFRSKLPQTLIK